jgi:hypothetical protein
MTSVKIQKPVVAITPQELAQKIAGEGLKGAIEKAIESGEKEYRAHFKRLLESRRSPFAKGVGRFQPSEADAESFMEGIYQGLPSFFRRMIDDAVDEQGRVNGLSQRHKQELKHELANVIDQEIRLKGKFA